MGRQEGWRERETASQPRIAYARGEAGRYPSPGGGDGACRFAFAPPLLTPHPLPTAAARPGETGEHPPDAGSNQLRQSQEMQRRRANARRHLRQERIIERVRRVRLLVIMRV